MSDFFVRLVFKPSHLQKQTPDFIDLASLELEHPEPNTDFIDGHYLGKFRFLLESILKLHLQQNRFLMHS